MAEQRPDPIIVFGAPRSGTTYLQELLNIHPDVFVSHETRIFAWLHDAVSVLTHEDRCLVTYREQFIDHLRSALPQVIRDFYRSLATDAIYWGDKNPHYADWNNNGCLELVADLFPNTRFIDLIRDGRHVVSSLLQMRTDDGTPWVDFDSAHHTWTQHVDRGHQFGGTLPSSHYRRIRYEQLVTDDVGAARELFAYLDLDFDPAVEEFCLLQQRERTPFSRPARDLSAGVMESSWSTIFTPEQRLRSLDLIGDRLVRYGYETEASLEDLRAGIEADLGASAPRASL